MDNVNKRQDLYNPGMDNVNKCQDLYNPGMKLLKTKVLSQNIPFIVLYSPIFKRLHYPILLKGTLPRPLAVSRRQDRRENTACNRLPPARCFRTDAWKGHTVGAKTQGL